MKPRRRIRRRVAAALLVLWAAQGSPRAAAETAETAPGLADLGAVVAGAMAAWQVPGLALGVVRADDVILLRGYGTLGTDDGRPVTPDTVFAAGSITKTVTVTLLGMLADDGRLDWDAPVTTYLPGFRLLDADAGAAITARGLVGHTSGLPRHDVLWYTGVFPRADMVRRLRWLKPTRPLGTTFQYQNLMVMTAGYMAGRIAGTSWEALVRRRILEPLGMAASRLSLAAFRAAGDAAKPYFLAPSDGERTAIPLRDTDAIGPAASLYTSARDLTQFLRLHVAEGRGSGRQLLAPGSAREMLKARIDVPGGPAPEFGPVHYGMGLFLTIYRGRRLAYHPGVIDGYGALFSFMPDDALGVIVLTNVSGANRAPAAVTRALYDRLLGLGHTDWTARLAAEQRRAAAGRAERDRTAARARAGRPTPAPPPRPLAAYAGAYDHPAYGRIAIGVTDAGLTGAYNGLAFALEHEGGDAWRVAETAWPIREGLMVRFRDDGAGAIAHLLTAIADGPTYRFNVGDVTFRRAGGR